MYEVLLERTAERDLKRFPSSQFLRIVPQIKMLAHNPRPPGSRKLVGTDRDWRIRVGDYRILYEQTYYFILNPAAFMSEQCA